MEDLITRLENCLNGLKTIQRLHKSKKHPMKLIYDALTKLQNEIWIAIGKWRE